MAQTIQLLERFILLEQKKLDIKQILKYAKRVTKIPIVTIGGINSKNYKKLLLNNANFLAISGYIWNNKKLNPKEAMRKLK